ncbi:hypothetical protein GCM10027051_03550 [Niabella terrae]
MIFHFFKKIRISFCLTVCNEVTELENLLNRLIPYIRKGDEILVLRDTTLPDRQVQELLLQYKPHITAVIEKKLENDFSRFKNNLIREATGDYIFQIDADELPQEHLLASLRGLLARYSRADCFCVARINTVKGINDTQLQQWNWKLNEQNYINYPDYQMRIFRTRKGIHWENRVHEKLVNFTRLQYLPSENFDLCLIHEKTIDRQMQQNKRYENM